MSVKMLKNRWSTINSQLDNGIITLIEAQEKAVILLADAYDLQNNGELSADDAYKLDNLIKAIEDMTASKSDDASC